LVSKRRPPWHGSIFRHPPVAAVETDNDNSPVIDIFVSKGVEMPVFSHDGLPPFDMVLAIAHQASRSTL
jgi:hypothetical protein